MAHKTLVGGTAYEIKGGRDLIGGTGYSTESGKTLVNGTARDIVLKKTEYVTVTIVKGGSGSNTNAVKYNGTLYYAPKTLTVEKGSVIQLMYGGEYNHTGGVFINNVRKVSSGSSVLWYNYTVNSDVTVTLYHSIQTVNPWGDGYITVDVFDTYVKE